MAEFSLNDDDRQYLQMMQDNITRMATNSANVKTWLITIVAGILAIGCNIQDVDYWLLLAIVPIIVFWYLDAYYLNIERGLRNREQRFLNIVKGVTLSDEGSSVAKTRDEAIFVFKMLNKDVDNQKLGYVKTGCMLFNKSVWPVYIMLLATVLLTTGIVNKWFLCKQILKFLSF